MLSCIIENKTARLVDLDSSHAMKANVFLRLSVAFRSQQAEKKCEVLTQMRTTFQASRGTVVALNSNLEL